MPSSFIQVHREENAFVNDKAAFNLAYVYILFLLKCHRQIPSEFYTHISLKKEEKKNFFFSSKTFYLFSYSALSCSLNNCIMFSFLWLAEAKIEILKARTQGKRGVLSPEKYAQT